MKTLSFHLSLLFLIFLFSCKKNEEGKVVPEDICHSWEIVDFMSVESVYYAKDPQKTILITFTTDNSYELKLDVNSCSGNFTINSDNEIEITGPGCTEICCDSDFSEKIVIMLPQVESYTFEGETLKLHVPAWGWINLELY